MEARRTSASEKGSLAEALLATSVAYDRSVRRGRSSSISSCSRRFVPWIYPPPFDFHYSELWRAAFERGELEPWPNRTNRDLASAITMALAGNVTLFGPPPSELFDPVPRADYIEAVLRDTATVGEYLAGDTRNVILTLPRIWRAVATAGIHSKESAARWALPKLPAEHRRSSSARSPRTSAPPKARGTTC